MSKDNKDIKQLHCYIQKEVWKFIKLTAAKNETSMTEIVQKCVNFYRLHCGED